MCRKSAGWVLIVEAEKGPLRRFTFMTKAPTLSESEFIRKYQATETVYVGKLLNAPILSRAFAKATRFAFSRAVGSSIPCR